MPIRALAVALPLTMITGCTHTMEAAPPVPQPAVAAAVTGPPGTGIFQPWQPGAQAVTYDPAVVPPGATATLTITRTGYATTVRLAATGLIPRHMYGGHLHTGACTAIPEEAGPHYQNHPDPASPPSANPVYANARNEIWLDFTATASGTGRAVATHGWSFDPARPPRSLVLHADHTHTAPGEAGKAGARVACLTLPTE
jgi:Cu-Zn family superoxide dismutase